MPASPLSLICTTNKTSCALLAQCYRRSSAPLPESVVMSSATRAAAFTFLVRTFCEGIWHDFGCCLTHHSRRKCNVASSRTDAAYALRALHLARSHSNTYEESQQASRATSTHSSFSSDCAPRSALSKSTNCLYSFASQIVPLLQNHITPESSPACSLGTEAPIASSPHRRQEGTPLPENG